MANVGSGGVVTTLAAMLARHAAQLVRALVSAVGLLAFGGGVAEAQVAERFCGPITAVSVTDLPSGGSIHIAGRHYLVGSVAPDAPRLPPLDQLLVGVRVCAEGTPVAAVGNPTAYRIPNGRIVVEGLPSTSTVGSSPLSAAAMGALLAGLTVAGLLLGRRGVRRTALPESK